MPTVNIYTKNNSYNKNIEECLSGLRLYLVEKLSCGDIKLEPEEFSIRILGIIVGQMIAPIEVEITAHAFQERIIKQDQICFEVANYLKDKIPEAVDIKVWLKLTELGHSF